MTRPRQRKQVVYRPYVVSRYWRWVPSANRHHLEGRIYFLNVSLRDLSGDPDLHEYAQSTYDEAVACLARAKETLRHRKAKETKRHLDRAAWFRDRTVASIDKGCRLRQQRADEERARQQRRAASFAREQRCDDLEASLSRMSSEAAQNADARFWHEWAGKNLASARSYLQLEDMVSVDADLAVAEEQCDRVRYILDNPQASVPSPTPVEDDGACYGPVGLDPILNGIYEPEHGFGDDGSVVDPYDYYWTINPYDPRNPLPYIEGH